MGSIRSDTAKSAKQLAKQSAKQVIKEPFEILGGTGRQVVGIETPEKESLDSGQGNDGGVSKNVTEEKRKADKIKSRRLIEALENEIADIRSHKEKEREEKEALEKQKKNEEEQKEDLQQEIEVESKPSRRLVTGIKGKLSKLKRKSEIRLPPSG